ncbi:S8 family serine peptidase [Luteimonas granuli]|uniref:S8 family serine peptidase n=1 Tax=Luteimonas granuli TaxID=1176533 RepID=A0A518N1L6_9GAMM|nr:S8 family serine peptidase [Luteimonas granuli]QDW65821.1 S8 family serine peptidase [Luteimonas granuli]
MNQRKKLSVAVGVVVSGLAIAASAHAATYVVSANGNGLNKNQQSSIEAAGGTITANLPQVGIAIVESDNPDFATAAAAIAGLTTTRDIQLEFDIPQDLSLVGEEIGPDFANPPASGEDDIRFDLQWGAGAIDVAGAWNAGYRGQGATIAVLDSGVACLHPDIAPNLDLDRSTSFVPGEGVCRALVSGFNHGTHVAGIAAAADNGIGTIGVAPEARIIAVKVLSEVTGSGGFAGIIQGIVHATDAGANVINMSLGVRDGLAVGGKEVAELVNATKRAVQYARSQGTLVVASTGNDARNMDYDANVMAFPGGLPGVLAISATAPDAWGMNTERADLDLPASYSNHGRSEVAFAAPGGDFDSEVETLCVVAGVIQPCWVFDGVFAPGGYSISGTSVFASYSWAAGTSMAAPHVAGVAALIYGKHPGIKPAQVEAILRKSAEDLGEAGNDPFYGAGRVNAAAAVRD